MDGAIAKTPGFSNTLEAKRDIFSEKVQPQVGYSQSAFNPFTVTKGNNDPVVKELARLAQSDAQSQFNTPSENIGNVSLLDFKNAKNQSAFDRFLELSGYGMKEALYQRMQSPSYINGSDGNSFYTASSRANMLREVMFRLQDAAFLKVRREFPGLDAVLRADKENKLDTKVGKTPRNAMDKILDFSK